MEWETCESITEEAVSFFDDNTPYNLQKMIYYQLIESKIELKNYPDAQNIIRKLLADDYKFSVNFN